MQKISLSLLLPKSLLTYDDAGTLAEAQKINLSLLELGNTIQALAAAGGSDAPGRHIPFRNSTLTRLLQARARCAALHLSSPSLPPRGGSPTLLSSRLHVALR